MNSVIKIIIFTEIFRIQLCLGHDFFLEKALKVFPLLWESFPEISSVYIHPFGIHCTSMDNELYMFQQVGNRIIWQEYELFGGTDTFQIEETIKDQNGFYHSTGNLMDPFYIWLKYGDTKEGFLHIDEVHGEKHFEDEWNLMSDREKSDFILRTIKNIIGTTLIVLPF